MNRFVLPCLLLTLVVASGCVAPGESSTDPTAITDRVDQRMESIDSLQVTMAWQIDTPNSTTNFSAQVAYKRPNLVNLTYMDPPLLDGIRQVGNGSKFVATNPNTQRYATFNVTSNGSGPAGVFLNLSSIQNATFEGNETIAGEDAVKLSYAVDQSEVSLFVRGGTQTSRVAEQDDGVNVTVWMDRERWVPVRATLNYTAFREPMSMTIEYENVTLNEPIPDERFESEVGPQATEVDTLVETILPENATIYNGHTRLADALGDRTVPKALPGNFTFRQGYSFGNETNAIYRLFYTNESHQRELQHYTKNISVLSNQNTRGIDGHTVAVGQVRRATILEWHCEASTYILIGVTDADELASTVEAIGCGTAG